MTTMNATDFKARCLAVLDQIEKTGESVTILRHGKPVAQLVPPARLGPEHPQGTLRGTVEILGDIVSPVLPADAWESEASGK